MQKQTISPTQLQESFLQDYLTIPSGPGCYGNNRKARNALSRRFSVSLLNLCPWLSPTQVEQSWNDVRDMARLHLLSEE